VNSKALIIIAPVVALIAAAAGWLFLKPAPAAVDETAQPGLVHTLADPFVVNLADSGGVPRFVKVGVALRLARSSDDLVTPAGTGAPATVEGEAQVRDIVIAALQARTSTALGTARGRAALKREIVRRITRDTDIDVLDVYYTEFAVQ